MDYVGLKIISTNRREWRWVGHSVVTNRFTVPVRVEHWARACALCGRDFIAKQKLPRKVTGPWKRHAEKYGETINFKSITVPLDRRYGTLEITRCPECRATRRAQKLV